MLAELLPLTPGELTLFSVVLFVAYMVKGLSGFGSGLVAIPLLAFVLPLTFVVPVLGLLSYSGTVVQSLSFRKDVAWRDMLPLIPFSLAGIALALWLLVNVDMAILTLILGLFIFCYSIYSLIPRGLAQANKGSRWWAVIAGGFAGLVGALFGTGGPFYVLYLKMRRLNKKQFRASITMIFLFDGGARMFGYFASGLFDAKMLLLVLILLPVLFIAMYVGHRLHIKINERRFNQVVSLLLVISGASLAIKSIYLMA